MKVKIADLRPTQSVVGLYEVRHKIRQLQSIAHDHKGLNDYKRINPAPAVRAYNGHLYIIDHHHLAVALHHMKQQDIYVKVIKDYSNLSKNDFITRVQKHKWVYLKDQHGKDITFEQLPTSIAQLKNDPYRSLAAIVRDNHCFEKTVVPFAEFQWALYFRSKEILKNDVDGMNSEGMNIDGMNSDDEIAADIKAEKFSLHNIEEACRLAHSKDAQHLPGWKSESSKPSR